MNQNSLSLSRALDVLRWDAQTLADHFGCPIGFVNGMLDGRVAVPDDLVNRINNAAAAVTQINFEGSPVDGVSTLLHMTNAVRQRAILPLFRLGSGHFVVDLNPNDKFPLKSSRMDPPAGLEVVKIENPQDQDAVRSPKASPNANSSGLSAQNFREALALAFNQDNDIDQEAMYALAAQEFHVVPKLISKWASGERPIPDGVTHWATAVHANQVEEFSTVPSIFDYVSVPEYMEFRDTYRFMGRGASSKVKEERAKEGYYPSGDFGDAVRAADAVSTT